jgi:hypothetical protein
MLLSNKLEHILGISNNEMKPDVRTVTTKSSKNVWYEMGRTGRAGGKFQDTLQFPGLVEFT